VSDSIISFEGVDVRDVLHGQTTRNFKALELHNPIDGAFCDLKGRVITDFTAVLTADTSVLMRVNSAVTPLLQQHLAKYLMFSKTKMSLLDWRTWGCKGTVDIDATRHTHPTCGWSLRGLVSTDSYSHAGAFAR
jgi:folate-binding Fe-S cluster repair protein YgfZ